MVIHASSRDMYVDVFIIVLEMQGVVGEIGGSEWKDGDVPVGMVMNELAEVGEELWNWFNGVDVKVVFGEESEVLAPFDANDGDCTGWGE